MQRTSKTWIAKEKIDIHSIDKITTANLADYIISMSEKDINYDLIMELFGSFGGKSLCNTYDLLVVPDHSFMYKDEKDKEVYNKGQFTTTVGIYLFNLIMSGIGISRLFGGYLNKSVDKKQFSKIEHVLSYALIEDDITTKQLRDWENYMQWCMWFEDILSPNHSEKLLTLSKAVAPKKKELLKQYEKEIAEGNVEIAEKIEKELIDYALEYLKDDPSLDSFLSGGGGDIGNHLKNMFLMKGAIANPDPNAKQKYNIVTSSYIDGVSAEEYPIVAGSGAQGAYARSKKTEDGGYLAKLMVSAYQYLKLGPKGSDCGSDKYVEVILTEDNLSDWMYSYIVKNSSGETELLTSKNASKYIGKKVKFRFSAFCKYKDGFCNKCVGDGIYNSIEQNIGITISQIAETQKLRSMKGFHDARIKTTKIDINKAFYPY